MRRALRSVRGRTTLVAAGAFGIAFGLASFALVRVVDARVHDQVRRTAQTAAEGAAQQIASGTPVDQIARALRAPVYFELFDASGQHLAGAGPTLAEVSDDGRIVPVQLPRYIMVQRSVRFGRGGPVGTLVVATSLESVNRGVATLRRTLWWVTPALIAIVAAIVWLLVGGALHPVDQIRSEVESISSRTIDRRVPVPDTGDEIARLATTMNAMLDRLEAAQQRQREFVSDASHELRSPMSSMRTELEVALAHPAATDWPTMAGRVLGEHDRLEHLVDDLLHLARLEEGRPLRTEEVDLDDVVLSEAAHARRLPVRTASVSAGRVLGERRVLEQVVRNLLDNATRHATSEVSVGLRSENGSVLLTVDDDGAGVPEAERERIFQRFTRADPGRARDAGGTGLGLALVRRVVEAHGGTVRCDASPLGGARFEVALPSA